MYGMKPSTETVYVSVHIDGSHGTQHDAIFACEVDCGDPFVGYAPGIARWWIKYAPAELTDGDLAVWEKSIARSGNTVESYLMDLIVDQDIVDFTRGWVS